MYNYEDGDHLKISCDIVFNEMKLIIGLELL